MISKNITREMIANQRALKPLPMSDDGVWLNWPHSTKPKKPKRQARTSRTARYNIAKAFKPGSGRYS